MPKVHAALKRTNECLCRGVAVSAVSRRCPHSACCLDHFHCRVAKTFAKSVGGPGFATRSSNTIDFEMCIRVTALLDAWPYGVRAWTGWPDVGIL